MGALRLPHDIPWRLARVRPMSLGACVRSEEHTSELQSRLHLVCRLLLEKKKIYLTTYGETNTLVMISKASTESKLACLYQSYGHYTVAYRHPDQRLCVTSWTSMRNLAL